MIESYLYEASSFHIFGAGNTAIKVKNILQKKGKAINSFIVSSSPLVQYIDGIEIKSLDMDCGPDTSLPIVIAVFNREPNANFNGIIRTLKKTDLP